MAALKRSTKGIITSSDGRAPSKKPFSNKIVREMQFPKELCTQWRIQRISDASILVWAPKLCEKQL